MRLLALNLAEDYCLNDKAHKSALNSMIPHLIGET